MKTRNSYPWSYRPLQSPHVILAKLFKRTALLFCQLHLPPVHIAQYVAKAVIIKMKLRPQIIQASSLEEMPKQCKLTFKTKVLRLVSDVQHV